MKKLIWRNWPLAVKLFLSFLVVAVVPLMILTAYESAVAREEMVSATQDQNLRRARVTASAIDSFLRERLSDMRVLGLSPAAPAVLQAPTETARVTAQLLMRRTSESYGYDAILLLDKSGRVVLATNEAQVGRDYSRTPAVSSAIAGTAVIDDPRADPVDGKVYLRFSAPAQTAQDEIVGAVVGRIGWGPIDRLLAGDVSFAGRGSTSVLVDEQGVRLSHGTRPDLRFIPIAPLPPDLAQELVREGRYGPATTDLLGQENNLPELAQGVRAVLDDPRASPLVHGGTVAVGMSYQALAPLQAKRWVYVVATPDSVMFAPINEATSRRVLTSVFASVLALALGLVVTRVISGPLLRISQAAKRVSAGDLSQRVAMLSGDEVGELGASFNAMTAAIAAREGEIQSYVDRLEAMNIQLHLEIQHRQQAEEDVRQLNTELERRAEKLEAANKELESFTYSVSHDLRAPLRALRSFSEILNEDFAAELPDEAKRYLGIISRNARQMGTLIDDLLAFSRLSRAEMHRQTVLPSTLVQEALDTLQAEYEGREVDLALDVLPPTEADPHLLKQVFVNLLSNALKFTRKREVARIEVGTVEKEGRTVYFVRDNGTGFDMRYYAKLFGVFQRLHRADEFEGTGVGLAIVHRIVQRHGGRIWAEGEPDKGATFWFTLRGDTGNGDANG